MSKEPEGVEPAGNEPKIETAAERKTPAEPLPAEKAAPPKDLDNEYHESEDEDFEPGVESESDKEADAEFSNETEQYKGVQGSGLIKTRSQRLAAKSEPREKQASVVGSQTVDVDALWKEMNAGETRKQTDTREDYIDIKRTLKFAGKVQTETKRVPRSSAEAQEYLKSLHNDDVVPEDKSEDKSDSKPKTKSKPRPRKRKMSLLEEYEAGKARKVNTLEKSRLDWLGFVDKEGIQDDLKKHNRNGYLDKQGFLARVEHKMGEDIRSHRKN